MSQKDSKSADTGAAGGTHPQGGQATKGKQVLLQKIYLKDASVEVPDGPLIFTREWKPEIDVDLNTRINDIGENTHQVTVTITVTAKQGEVTAYIVEVQKAGVFQLTGFDSEAELRQILGTYCPNSLFPYVREVVGDLIQRAGFPQFLLQPINFDALYQQHLKSEQNSEQDPPPKQPADATH